MTKYEEGFNCFNNDFPCCDPNILNYEDNKDWWDGWWDALEEFHRNERIELELDDAEYTGER